MKPAIIMQDVQGRHNADPSTSERLHKNGQWKKQRIVCVIPAGDSIPARVALSHWNLIFPPNQGVCRILAQGMEVGYAYSQTIEMVLAHPDLKDFEYLLTLEHDNTPAPDGVLMLIEALEEHPEFAAVSGLYFTKGEGGCAQIWGDPKDPMVNFRPQVPQPDTVQECCGIGMGFALWRMSTFKDDKLPKPWFKTLDGREGKGVGTQDLTFWSSARCFGYRCAVDTRVKVGHFDVATGVTW